MLSFEIKAVGGCTLLVPLGWLTFAGSRKQKAARVSAQGWLRLVLAGCGLWQPAPAAAQLPLSPSAEESFSRLFEKSSNSGRLTCQVQLFKPFFDFSFRYEFGYVIECPLNQFGGKQTTIATLLRITPKGADPTLLGQSFTIPAMPRAREGKVDFRHLHADVEFSGVFAAGEGEYEIELAVIDDGNRLHRKSWRMSASPHGKEASIPAALGPLKVAAISLPVWKGVSEDGKGLRLTVLLDAAPANPYSSKLRAWDRAFLLGALSSLLRQLPLASVHLVAFNLDQQQELYRDEDFDHLGMYRLFEALTKLELGTVSYKILQRPDGWGDVLANLVRKEVIRERSADAVVFIGPNQRMTRKLPPEMFAPGKHATVPFFYMEYFPRYGSDFPDSIEHITNARNGTTFKLHSPGDLAEAISKMKKQLLTEERP